MKRILVTTALIFLIFGKLVAQIEKSVPDPDILRKPDCTCIKNLLPDGGFTRATADPGSSVLSQSSPTWKPGTNAARWSPDPGCCDKGFILMYGNKTTGVSVRQNGLNIIAGRKYRISFCARFPNNNGVANPFVRFRFRAYNSASTNPAPYTSAAGLIGLSANITAGNWQTYTLPDWTAPANFNALEVNPENDNIQNSGSYVSWGHIDNICFEEIKTENCCECGKWSNLQAGDKEEKKEYKCGSVINWNCSKPFYFSTGYLCAQKECKSILTYTVTLGEKVIKTGETVNTVNDFFTPLENGLYTIRFDGLCGSNRCKPCEITVKVTNCAITCCPLSLQIVNQQGNTNAYSKLRVTAINGSQIINSDPDNWMEQRNYPASVTWFVSGSNIPTGTPIDNDFMIYMAPGPSIQKLRVEWLDPNDVVKAVYEISIPCGNSFADDEDWTQYVQTIQSTDNKISVFAAKEEGEDECGLGEMLMKAEAFCPFTSSIQCVGNVHTITLQEPGGFSSYNWSVDKNGNVSTYTGSGLSFAAPASGEYKISMEAINGTDVCYFQDAVIIPDIQPDISFKKEDCTLKVNFTAEGWEDPSDVSSVNWSCAAIPGFPSAGQGTPAASYTFAQQGNYTINIVVTDRYGCTKTFSKVVRVSNKCVPSFDQYYTFCPDSCKSAKKYVNVVFENNSSGGFCPVKYTWDFGDGSPIQVTTSTNPVEHPFLVDCKTGGFFKVKLTMEDNDPVSPCKEVLEKTVEVTPCTYDFSYEVCPDGRVNFKAANGKYGTWSFPGSHSKAPWPYSDIKKKQHHWGQNKVVVRYNTTGDYLVSFTGRDEKGCVCTVSKTIHVEIDCCRKNQADRNADYFSVGNKNYKVKSLLAARQYPLYHRINAVTKLRVRKKLGNTGISYWGWSPASSISASITGKMYKRDDQTKCNCKLEVPVSDAASRYNKSLVRCSYQTNGRFRIRLGSTTADRIQSTHTVIIGGNTYTYNLELPKTSGCSNIFSGSSDCCTPFRWYTDWF